MLGLLCFLLVLKLAATLYSGSLDLCITWDNKFKPKGHRDCVDDKADMSGKKREEQVGTLRHRAPRQEGLLKSWRRSIRALSFQVSRRTMR